MPESSGRRSEKLREGRTAYVEALEYLYGLRPRGIRLGVKRLHRELERRGRPQDGFRIVHVAGTNGKGSTTAMVASMLRRAGYRTGLFTSPHVHRYLERMRVNGRPASESYVVRWVRENRPYFDGPRAPFLTFFEMTTLMAIERFAQQGCDVAVFEVGLGGRLDATNVLTSDVSVITHIGRDHMGFLGDTIASIAREKAGIIKRGVPVICGSHDEAARRVIARRAERLEAPLSLIDRDFSSYEGPIRMKGAHQADNAACAVQVAQALRRRGMKLPKRDVAHAIATTAVPGRLERIAGTPPFLLDGAHNVEGARALGNHLRDRSARVRRRGGKVVLVFASMRDKEHAPILAELDPFVDRRVFCEPEVWRAESANALARIREGAIARSIPDALSRARRLAGPKGLVVVAGSLFLMSAARAHLLGCTQDPPIAM